MKRFIAILLVLSTLTLSAQKITSKSFRLSNGLTKTLKIYTPKGYENDTIYKYPVSIILNDTYLFDMAVGNAKLFAQEDFAPKQIIVGIPTDIRPNKDVSIIKQNLSFTKNSKVFYSFIKDELLKYLKAEYKLSPFSTIIADRQTANFAMYFFNEPKPLFNAYIILDPTIDNEFINRFKAYDMERLKNIDNSYFLYMNNTTLEDKGYIRDFKNFKFYAESFELKNLKVSIELFEKPLNSISCIGEGLSKAYSMIFDKYKRITKREFEEKIKDLDPLTAIEYLENKYIEIDYLYGTNLNVRLEDFYAIENIVMDQQNGDYLRVLGDFALIKHPQSPLGDYYMGRFYEKGKDYERADSYYKSGYGKLKASDPMADAFYQNIKRVQNLLKNSSK